MQTVALHINSPAPTAPSDAAARPKSKRPISSYRKPVPTEEELELRELRQPRPQSMTAPSGFYAQRWPPVPLLLPVTEAQGLLEDAGSDHHAHTQVTQLVEPKRTGEPHPLAVWLMLVFERLKAVGRFLF